jgi:hypothetical protein
MAFNDKNAILFVAVNFVNEGFLFGMQIYSSFSDFISFYKKSLYFLFFYKKKMDLE